MIGASMEIFRPFREEHVLDTLDIVERDGGSPTTADERGGRRYRVRFVPTPGVPEVQFFCDEVTVLKALSISRAI